MDGKTEPVYSEQFSSCHYKSTLTINQIFHLGTFSKRFSSQQTTHFKRIFLKTYYMYESIKHQVQRVTLFLVLRTLESYIFYQRFLTDYA